MRERLTHYGPSPSKVGQCRRVSEDGEEVLTGDRHQEDPIGTGLNLSSGHTWTLSPSVGNLDLPGAWYHHWGRMMKVVNASR